MHPDEFSSLPISSYKLGLRALEASTLPPFLGSTLRGAFGHALKEAVCMMEHRDCGRCLLAERCPYPYLFETPAPPDLPLLRGQQQAPRPFVLTPPFLETTGNEHPGAEASPPGSEFGETSHGGNDLATARSLSAFVAEKPRQLATGGELNFALLLIGRAVEHLPYVVYAMSRLARHGLGVARARFELGNVAALDEHGAARVIYTGESARLAPHAFATRGLSEFVSARLDQLSVGSALRLRFLTPTRIRVEGNLQTGLSFPLLVRNLLRRVSLLMAVHGRVPLDVDYRALIERAASVGTRSADLRWLDWERYSSRQRTKMKLGGFVGETEYSGDALPEFLPLIAAGELLHVGTGSSFGLGQYRILP